MRLDAALAKLLPDYSRSRLTTWIKDGAVQLNGLACQPKEKLIGGEKISVTTRPSDENLAFVPEAMDLDIVYEDDTVLVINKPAGLVVHPAAGNWTGTLLNGLLGVATILPALTTAWPVVLASGLLFGGVFLSVVASTTALVRHNLPQVLWASGISAFTIVFAAGQIVGPTVVGWIADGPGGLARGLVFSAFALWLGALVAWRQRPL